MKKKNGIVEYDNFDEFVKDSGIDLEVFKMKTYLIKIIRDYCHENSISQKKLASMVPGLTQDRISKIYTGQVGHMTIDKLITILSVLKFKIAIKAKAA
jgi:predicted XRE-type DNA-binding protein